MSSVNDDIAAVFTTQDQAKVVECERGNCTRKRFPPGTPMYYVHALNPNGRGEGLSVCSECWVHYQRKTGTVSRSAVRESHSLDEQEKRYERHTTILRKHLSILRILYLSLGHMLSQVKYSIMLLKHKEEKLFLSVRVAMPNARPALPPMPPPSYIPSRTPQLAANSQGYTANHAHYHRERDQAIRQSLQEASGHFILLRVDVVRKVPGVKKVKSIDWVVEDHVSAHIGYSELLSLVYDLVLPIWNRFTEGKWPLHPTDITMSDKHCAPIQKGDRDIISEQFFHRKGKNTTVASQQAVFKKGVPYVLNAIISEEVFNAWEKYQDAEDEKEFRRAHASSRKRSGRIQRQFSQPAVDILLSSVVDDDVPSTAISNVQHATSQKCQLSESFSDTTSGSQFHDYRALKRQHHAAQYDNLLYLILNNYKLIMWNYLSANSTAEQIDLDSVPSAQAVDPSLDAHRSGDHDDDAISNNHDKQQYKSSGLDDDDLAQLATALRGQRKLTIKNNVLGRLFTSTAFVRVKAAHVQEFDTVRALIRAATENAEEALVPEYLLGDEESTFELTLRTTDQRVGRFKVAQFGKCEPCPFDTGEICAKQVIRTTLKTGQLVAYEGGRQLRELLPEVQCLVWAKTLHNVTMEWARDRFDDKRRLGKRITDEDDQPIVIPEMRFVEAWLAKEIVQGTVVPRVYLLEESIESHSKSFCKYINNNSAAPVDLLDPRRQDRALFLAFTQHYQYWLTHKMAFVTDFQGGWNLLTDPQIVTHPALGPIFASGNLPNAYETFETQHKCNRYCQFFNLPTDYENWTALDFEDKEDPELNAISPGTAKEADIGDKITDKVVDEIGGDEEDVANLD
ncbi:hypothetical protein BDY19DRAFT_905830 [Irpex rosettiformis]|uniref:Uncharacterized protein n=1 Tax=Irpex rosettiformis TaxID=378272 RepID=A0ACB8U5X2_9APHY|nr:hypothetical protein BDY19DRAFT_905830 [Irpex rosettiformis]